MDYQEIKPFTCSTPTFNICIAPGNPVLKWEYYWFTNLLTLSLADIGLQVNLSHKRNPKGNNILLGYLDEDPKIIMGYSDELEAVNGTATHNLKDIFIFTDQITPSGKNTADTLAKLEAWSRHVHIICIDQPSSAKLEDYCILKNKIGASILEFRFGYLDDTRVCGHAYRYKKSIDVLYAGPERTVKNSIVNKLLRMGYKVEKIGNTYGVDRDRLIDKSRIVLIMVDPEDSKVDLLLAAYCIYRGVTVILERSSSTYIPMEFRTGCTARWEVDIPGEVRNMMLFNDWHATAQNGHYALRKTSQRQALAELLGRIYITTPVTSLRRDS